MKKAIPQKILVILGPTATGKSSLSVELARKFKGEVISADSRQVYTGLDIGTGKITKKEMRGVPHHMLNIISPKKTYTVAEFQKEARVIISEIISRGKLPILCGGTGLYIQSIVDGVVFPEVPPNTGLRKELGILNIEKLVQMLKKFDPKRLETIDAKNPVRLMRAIEIAKALGKVPALKKKNSEYGILNIGLKLDSQKLKEKIHQRLLSRIKKGMVRESKNLHKKGLSFKRMRMLGLEYKYLADLLENKISKKDFITRLETDIWHYAKRQMTWFKRDKNIQWFTPGEAKQISTTVKNFLTQK